MQVKIMAWSPDPKRVRKLHYRAVLGCLAATHTIPATKHGTHEVTQLHDRSSFLNQTVRFKGQTGSILAMQWGNLQEV